ncbi:MAG TPA: hypothetical protein VGM64_03265 [Lacunisphaera sp.]|jgi:hypothetical protein
MPIHKGQRFATLRVFVSLFGCLVVALFFSGCAKSQKDKLIGVWKLTSGDRSLLFGFRADKSATISSSGAGWVDRYGSWRMSSPTTVAIDFDAGNGPLELTVIAVGPTELDVRLPAGMDQSKNGEIATFLRISDAPMPPNIDEKYARSPEGRAKAAAILNSRKIDLAVLNNARQLSAAADLFYLGNGKTTADFSDLVGSDKNVKSIQDVGGESYPEHFTQGITITISGVEGARTITYAP